MYQLSVPFLLDQIEKYGAEPFVKALKELGADMAVLALDCYEVDKAKQERIFSLLRESVPIFREAGLKVGVWVWTFMVRAENDFTHITSPNGAVSKDECCPSDENFCDFACEYLQNIAKAAPDLILFDDDFRYGFLDCGLGCTCENHRAYMSALLGEPVPAEDLGKLIFGGGKNKYRSAFLQANGHYFKEFAKRVREAVDAVDPTIRVGLCACMTNWDFDGVSAAELARILAGNTKPFMRLIGAPYWSHKRNWGNRLQDVVELERMERSWCGEDIEILAEGDSWPRPRFTCAANVLEGFDMALRASGALDGIHKYVLDYTSSPDYEQGYCQKHIQNRKLYDQIDKCFGGKTPVGVRVYEAMQKFEDMEVPACFEGKDAVQNTFFSYAARMLSAQSIPTTWEGLGTVGIAFGENVKYLPDGALDHGLILDVTAAKYLQAMGVDVGLLHVGKEHSVTSEYLPAERQHIFLRGCPVTEMTLNSDAVVESIGEHQLPVSYTYQNARGQRFLVFGFDGYTMTEHAFKQYARGRQIERFIASLGKKLPASMLGNPDCYLLCKENASEKAVFIGNFFADECMNKTVVLDKEYREIEFINCRGKLNGNKVELEYIAPFASVGFLVKQ